jgi:hypothetical protein
MDDEQRASWALGNRQSAETSSVGREKSANTFRELQRRWALHRNTASCPFVIGTKDFENFESFL